MTYQVNSHVSLSSCLYFHLSLSFTYNVRIWIFCFLVYVRYLRQHLRQVLVLRRLKVRGFAMNFVYVWSIYGLIDTLIAFSSWLLSSWILSIGSMNFVKFGCCFIVIKKNICLLCEFFVRYIKFVNLNISLWRGWRDFGEALR